MKDPFKVRIQNASLAYPNKTIYSNLALDLPAGKWIALLGPSGIGKSSLLRSIAGLSVPEGFVQGTIETNNDLSIHQQIAYMAQTDLLLPWLTALENTLLGIKLRAHPNRSHYQEKAISLFEQVGLAHVMHAYPKELSGGMRQRVALIRTLLEDQPIVLMDEPFSALDAMTRYKLQTIAIKFLQDKTVLFITHDPLEAIRLANHIYIMQGAPAILKKMPCLTSQPPRSLTDSEVLNLQTILLEELLSSGDDS